MLGRTHEITTSSWPSATLIHSVGGVGRGGEFGAAATIVRDDQGHYLGSSALVVGGVDDTACLAALACREAQALAQDLMLNYVVIACEERSIIEDIKTGNEGRHGMIIGEIKSRISLFNSCHFIFESRTSSKEASKVVKFSS